MRGALAGAALLAEDAPDDDDDDDDDDEVPEEEGDEGDAGVLKLKGRELCSTVTLPPSTSRQPRSLAWLALLVYSLPQR